MITLRDKQTGTAIGEITEAQQQFLIDQLEEEASDNQDYYINRPTLLSFAVNGGDPALIELLKAAMGEREDMEIAWSRS